MSFPSTFASVQAAQRAAAAAPREIISFIKPNLTISLVDDQSVLTPAQILPQVGSHDTTAQIVMILARHGRSLRRYILLGGIATQNEMLLSAQILDCHHDPVHDNNMEMCVVSAATAVGPPGQ